MDDKYKIGTLVYSQYDCLGMIIAICSEPYSSKYLVEWFCQQFYGSYTEQEIDKLRSNLAELMREN